MQLLQQNYSNTFTVSLLQGCTGSQIKRTTIGRIYFIILEAVELCTLWVHLIFAHPFHLFL